MTSSTDPVLLEAYRAAELELGRARAAGAKTADIIPLLVKAREAWEACYRPALQKANERKIARRTKANDILHRIAANLDDEDKALLTEVYGIPF